MDKVNRIRNGISIHALHEESDAPFSTICATESVFQSTLSMRRATRLTRVQHVIRRISIHALHEESDGHRTRWLSHVQRISIHALHEESDSDDSWNAGLLVISIHALHEESDGVMPSNTITSRYFNPRSP